MPRPRVFVASSREKLFLANSLHTNLEPVADVTVWTQDVFRPSEYPLEALERVAAESDAGIFVLAPDDLSTMRGHALRVARDNIILELGMFVGAMGRRRTFLVVPRGKTRPHLPSDLAGLTTLDYDGRRRDKNWTSALGPACTKIADALRRRRALRSEDLPLERITWFGDAESMFRAMIPRAKRITTFFIHSRRWRENNLAEIDAFLRSRNAQLNVFLPDPKDRVLTATFRRNFDDGPRIPSFIRDACSYFARLRKRHGAKVTVRFAKNYPTYSFYLLDRTAVLAMYPTTDRRRPVPALQVALRSPIGDFLLQDIDRLRNTSRALTKAEYSEFLLNKP